MEATELEYVGFWARVGATIIDTVLLLMVTMPLMWVFYGDSYWTSTDLVMGPIGFLIEWVLPTIAVIVFWIARQATPGKICLSAKIVDADSGAAPSNAQLIGRYFAYAVATIPLGLGLLWIAFDKRKQGWHDKLAKTIVVRPKERGQEQVTFEDAAQRRTNYVEGHTAQVAVLQSAAQGKLVSERAAGG